VTEPLGRRCALVLLAALTLAALVGLLAWGPVPLDADVHRYAEARRWLGLPNAGNVLANLPLLLVGLWGWRVTRDSGWAAPLRRAWMGFHACVAGGSLIAATYHVAPNAAGYVLAQIAMSAAFVLLTLGMLAERVHVRFGARPFATTVALLGAATLVALASGATGDGAIDLRPFLLLQLLPVLLIPAGALSLPGTHTRASDWLLMLVAYAAAQGFHFADAAIHAATGGLGGHALMHLALAAVAAQLAYRAATAASAVSARAGTTRAQTSLNTAA
jgi:hypothetical protein